MPSNLSCLPTVLRAFSGACHRALGLVFVPALTILFALPATAEIEHGGVAKVDTWFAVTTTEALPSPDHCEVNPADALNGIVLAPSQPTPLPATVLDIWIRSETDAPIPSADVEIIFENSSPEECADIQLLGVTDVDGYVRISPLAGGGCTQNENLAARVRVNGVTIRNFLNVKSPDFDGSGGDRVVDLSDLVDFSQEFLGGPSDCHDYDNNGATDLSDLIIFGPAFSGSIDCP